jgi:3-hydroxybutyryl-CoA dehydrogenase
VVLRSRSPHGAEVALARIGARLDREVARGSLGDEEAGEIRARINPTAALEDLAGCEVVIESIVEALEPKRVLFAQLGAMLGPEVVLATNTSTLSVGQLAQVSEHPERVVGLHFFNPVPRMALVEVVQPLEAADWAVERARTLARRLGKEPVTVADEPGFIVNALLFPSINQAVRLVERGVASIEDVDRAMVLGANHPMGPLALADLVGLDVTVAILEQLWHATGDPALVPASTLRRMVAAGRLGRKSGRGFYRYEAAQP